MALLSIVYVLFIALGVYVAFKAVGVLKKIIVGLLFVIIVATLSFYFVMTPAQQGELLPMLGKLSLLIDEPEDLWVPLDQVKLSSRRDSYTLIVHHTYVGNHSVEIVFSNPEIDPFNIPKDSLSMTVKFDSHDGVLFSASSGYVGAFNGANGNGLSFIKYSVSDDVPIAKTIRAKVAVEGDLKDFIKKYGSATLRIKKTSDL